MKTLRNTRLFILTIFLAFYARSYSQIPVFEWAANIQGGYNVDIYSVTTDTNENVIVAGRFIGWQDMDPGPAELLIQSNGDGDIFVMKLDPDGNLLWVKTAGGIYNQTVLGIAADTAGNVYINGLLGGDSFDIDPGPGTTVISTAISTGGFLFSLDPDGNFRWAHTLPGFLGGTAISGVSYSPEGSIVITERFGGTMDFDFGPGTYEMTSVGPQGAYILKLDLDGNFGWSAPLLGGLQKTSDADVNSSGDIFIAGSFTQTLDVDPGPGTYTLTSNGSSDVFVLKLNENGEFQWAKSFGGANREVPENIACDDQGNVYVSGYYEGPTDLDPGPGVFAATPLGNEDNFILRLDDQGNFSWALPLTTTNFLPPPSLTTDAAGNLYVGGAFRDTMDMAPGTAVHLIMSSPSNLTISNVDCFVSKIAANGDLLWVKQFGGEVGDIPYAIHVSPQNTIHVTGQYDETVDFNPGYGDAIYTSGLSYDGFNLKYSQCSQTVPAPDLAVLSDTTATCSVDTLIPPTATEFCLGTITGTPDIVFPITTPGTTTITWTYDAGNGFTATQTQNVTIVDNTAPVPDVAGLPELQFVCSTASLPPPGATDNCSGNVIITNNAVFPILANTTVIWTYDDGNGNTATQSQNIVIAPIDNGISQVNEVTLSADASGYSYQWLDCDNGNTPVAGATNQTFTALANGSYAVRISNGTCTETSDCIAISEVGIAEEGQFLFTVSPNPSDGKFLITFAGNPEEVAVTVVNSLGQNADHEYVLSGNECTLRINGAPGVYLLQVISGNLKKEHLLMKL